MGDKLIFLKEYSTSGALLYNESLTNYYPDMPKVDDYISKAVNFAKRHKADIYVSDSGIQIKIKLMLQVGMFFGSIKGNFIELLNNIDDFFIFPVNENNKFSIEVLLLFNK